MDRKKAVDVLARRLFLAGGVAKGIGKRAGEAWDSGDERIDYEAWTRAAAEHVAAIEPFLCAAEDHRTTRLSLPQCEHVDERHGRCKLPAAHPGGPMFHPDVVGGHMFELKRARGL